MDHNKDNNIKEVTEEEVTEAEVEVQEALELSNSIKLFLKDLDMEMNLNPDQAMAVLDVVVDVVGVVDMVMDLDMVDPQPGDR